MPLKNWPHFDPQKLLTPQNKNFRFFNAFYILTAVLPKIMNPNVKIAHNFSFIMIPMNSSLKILFNSTTFMKNLENLHPKIRPISILGTFYTSKHQKCQILPFLFLKFVDRFLEIISACQSSSYQNMDLSVSQINQLEILSSNLFSIKRNSHFYANVASRFSD